LPNLQEGQHSSHHRARHGEQCQQLHEVQAVTADAHGHGSTKRLDRPKCKTEEPASM
jgi:hypothetical protein